MLPATVDHLYRFPIRSCGVAGSNLIARGGRGAVVAVFDSSFYFDVDGTLACVVRADVPDGPMHLVLDVPTSLSWKSVGLEVGATVRIADRFVVVDRAFRFDATFMNVWRPETQRGTWTRASLNRGIRALKQIINSRLSAISLSDTLVHAYGGANVVRSLAAICNEHFELEGSDGDLKALSALIGFGNGLTPSGDDFLGGFMIALHVAGYFEACAAVWSIIGPVAEKTTNRVSFGHLSHASQGRTIEPLHTLAIAALGGRQEEISNLTDEIDRVGHSSGWDIVAGMIFGFEVVESQFQLV
ncbi:MAG: DUF2877 domain-containing protein [Pseudomonadota bacterium]